MGTSGTRPTSPNATYRQLKLKIWHDGCWTLDVTEQHSGAHIIEKSLHSSDERILADLILKTESNSELDPFIESIESQPLVHEVTVLKRSPGRARVIVNYENSDSIVPEIVNSNFMPIEPVHITGGHEYWIVLARSDRLDKTLDRLRHDHNIDVMAISEISPSDGIVFTDFIDEIYDTLSDRQLEALLTAKDKGYYCWPREIKAKEVAETVGVSGPTYLEHLRKAEKKVLEPLLEKLEERRTDLHFLDSKNEQY